MQLRRWRPVAALTLALLAAPFLAATAVAAQSATTTHRLTKERRVVHTPSWLEIIRLATAETIAPPKPEAPPPAVRATPPPAPALSDINDKSTWIFPAQG